MGTSNRPRERGNRYTKDGEFVSRIKLNEEKMFSIAGIAVSMEGHIAAAVEDVSKQ